MKKLKFDIGKFLVYGAAIYQAYQVGRALAILFPGGWEIQGIGVGGLTLGAIVNLSVAYTSTQMPTIMSKSRRKWSTVAFFSILVISPVLVAPALYLVINPELNPFWRYVLSFGYAVAPDAAIALSGFVAGKSLMPLLSESESDSHKSHSHLEQSALSRTAKSASRTASRPNRSAKRAKSLSEIVCRYAGAGCEITFGSQNAENAHARWCKFKPTISMPSESAEVITSGRNKKA